MALAERILGPEAAHSQLEEGKGEDIINKIVSFQKLHDAMLDQAEKSVQRAIQTFSNLNGNLRLNIAGLVRLQSDLTSNLGDQNEQLHAQDKLRAHEHWGETARKPRCSEHFGTRLLNASRFKACQKAALRHPI